MPYAFIADHDTQFDNDKFEDYCIRSEIKKLHFAPVNPQCNKKHRSQTEPPLDIMKRRLDNVKGNWIDILHNILWAYITMSRTMMGKTPFMLIFGMEVAVPIEVCLPSHSVLNFDSPKRDLIRRLDLDLVEEVREHATLRVATYPQKTARFYNKMVKSSTLKEGDHLLKKVIQKGNNLETI